MTSTVPQPRDKSLLVCVALFLVTVFALYLRTPAKSSSLKESVSQMMIVATGDLQGRITPTECGISQPGGLPRRAKEIRKLAAQADLIVVDVGGAATGNLAYDELLLEYILRCEMATNIAAHNIGSEEAKLSIEQIRDLGRKTRIPFVSSNIKTTKPSGFLPEPVRIVERNGRRTMILGLLSPTKCPRPFVAEDPTVAVQTNLRYYGWSGSEQEHLIVLGDLTSIEVLSLLNVLPQNRTTLVLRNDQNNSIVDVNLLRSAEAKKITLLIPPLNGQGMCTAQKNLSKNEAGWDINFVLFDKKDEYPTSRSESRDIEKLILDFQMKLRQEDFSVNQCSWGSQSLFGPSDNALRRQEFVVFETTYVGSESCTQECHTDKSDKHHPVTWKRIAQNDQYDLRCLRCHTTGFGERSGFTSVNDALRSTAEPENPKNFLEVGCESCHGPCSEHVADRIEHRETDRVQRLVDRLAIKTPFNPKQACAHCHTPEHSPAFNVEASWEQIKHRKPDGLDPKNDSDDD